MPNWTYGGIRIYVQEMQTSDEQLIARLNPLAGGTVKQVFGWDDLVVSINCYVVGLVDISHLRSLVTSGVSFDLYSPYSINGYPYLLRKISTNIQKTICQTLRPDLDPDAPVYIVDLELEYDE